MNIYKEKTAQNGYAAGYAFICQRAEDLELKHYRQENAERENEKFETAVTVLENRLSERMKRSDEDTAALIEAELLMLQDEDYTGYAGNLIRKEALSAPEAVKEACEKLCGKLISSENEYIRERCDDIRGLTGNLLDILTKNEKSAPEKPCILVGKELSPGDISGVEPELILGIITEKGSPASHVSVLAGNLGVPYIYGLEDPEEKICDGDYLIMDADSGVIYVNPPAEMTEDAQKKQNDLKMQPNGEHFEKAEPENVRNENKECGNSGNDREACVLKTRTKIYANIGGLKDIDILTKSEADGIGLVRSEFLFLQRPDEPSEEEQFEAYKRIAVAMNGREAVIRTMDIGSDKRPEWLRMPDESNPALGYRGLRVSLSNRELFRKQLRAIFRAAAFGNLSIMVPMVTSLWEIEAVREEFKTVSAELDKAGIRYRIPKIGAMIETPSAVMIASELAEKVSFFSIGTNDLTQYTLALDREASGLDDFYDPLHEAIFRMIGMTVKAAHEKNIPVAVCGELGSNPKAVERLIEMGIDELSVSVRKISGVRKMVFEAESRSEMTKNTSAASREVRSPADGEPVPMDKIPDQVFSSGMMGECIGIIPSSGIIYAPVDGYVATVAKTGHAIAFKNEYHEILVHVGLDTVKLGGEGFKVRVSEGQAVRQGQTVMEADIEKIRKKGFNPMVIVVRTV